MWTQMTTHRVDPVAPAEAAMTDDERSALRDHLEADIRRLRRTVAGAAAEQERRARDHEDGRGDESDVSAYRSGIGEDVSLAEHAAMLLARNEHALGRLADGSYEQCESCGHPIGTQRLLALPRATLCMACQRGGDPLTKPRLATRRARKAQPVRRV
jgi:DnaK suppressor protein